ncbi:MAG: hypothetical protein H7240_10325 [Glaciimonas sp.]|nr:hypothetical protein [Glaciimonas sp.]
MAKLVDRKRDVTSSAASWNTNISLPGHTYAEQSLAVSSSGRVYDAATPKPVAGATILMSTDVAAFDPSVHLIGMEHSGENTTDEHGFFTSP